MNVPVLTMELVEGQPLLGSIAPGGLAVDALLDVALPLSDAVAAAHEVGIVHRDLKLANVMIDDDGRLKVLDFGLAQPVDSGAPGDHEATATRIEPAAPCRVRVTRQ